MTAQLNLFTEPRARHDDPSTSRDAAARVKPSQQSRLERVARIVDEAGYWGATADDVHQRVVAEDGRGVRSTWHGAVSDAAAEGLIVPRGEKHVRLSVNNSPMRIYITPGNQR